MTATDPWAQWILDRRFGGDELQLRCTLERLYPVRDRILNEARVGEGDVLLDVGTGDGLVAFGALDRVGTSGRVIFSDISSELLDRCRDLASETGMSSRCVFVQTPADDLASVASGSVDVVTTRAVLIYVQDKLKALREFHRVLKSGGRISVYEPINRFMLEKSPDDLFFTYDVRAIQPLADKIDAMFGGSDGFDSRSGDPMVNFDERDLFEATEQAGFDEIHLDYRADSEPSALLGPLSWEAFLATSANPLAPTFGEMVERALTPPERLRFETHLRPLVERGEGRNYFARAHIWAVKQPLRPLTAG